MGRTLDGLDQGSFLSTNISASAAVDIYVKIISRPACVFANEACTIGFVDGLLDV